MLLEQLTVEITIHGSKNVIMSCMYRSPSDDCNKFNVYVDMFLNYGKNNAIFYVGILIFIF